MSKLVVSAIGPACSVQDHGRGGYQRYGLVASGAMDRLALAAANTLLGNEPFAAAVEVGPFTASFTARDGAVRVALCGAPRSVDIAGRAVPHRCIDYHCRRRDAQHRLRQGRRLQLSRDRRRHRGRADLRQPRGQSARGIGQSFSAAAAAGRRTRNEARKRRGRTAHRAPRRERTDPRGARPAGRRIFRRRQGAVPRQRLEDFGDQRPHGLPARRARHQASARPQHRLRRHGRSAASRCPAMARRSC